MPANRLLPLLAIVISLFVPAATDALQPASPAGESKRLEWLRAEIARHDGLYHRLAEPEISDAAYDALVAELEVLEGGESARCGGAPADDRTGQLPSARHLSPMLSLSKGHDSDALRRFHTSLLAAAGTGDIDYWIEPKVDGMAVSAVYEGGRLVRVLTRGNGVEGELVTANLLACAGLPDSLDTGGRLPVPDLVELRGEAYIGRDCFARLNSERLDRGMEPFSNARNLVAATLRAKDPGLAASRGVRVVFFEPGCWLPADTAPSTLAGFRESLRAWGLPILEDADFVHGVDDLVAAAHELAGCRGDWPFEADGLVVKVDDFGLRRILGLRSDSPRWAIAQKFSPPQAVTSILAITWTVGKTGRLTPVAELEPVRLEGRTVSRATLHSKAWLEQYGYRAGDRVRIILAGDVIPQVAGFAAVPP